MMELLRYRKFITHPNMHKTMLRAGAIAILTLLVSPLFATSAQRLTMDQALEAAFANNPDSGGSAVGDWYRSRRSTTSGLDS